MMSDPNNDERLHGASRTATVHNTKTNHARQMHDTSTGDHTRRLRITRGGHAKNARQRGDMRAWHRTSIKQDGCARRTSTITRGNECVRHKRRSSARHQQWGTRATCTRHHHRQSHATSARPRNGDHGQRERGSTSEWDSAYQGTGSSLGPSTALIWPVGRLVFWPFGRLCLYCKGIPCNPARRP